MDINPFDILSNEVISYIVAYLDAVSLLRFCGCSKRLLEFNNITNEDWLILYSIQWLVDEQELCLYGDKDWKQYFITRYTLEKCLRQENDKNGEQRNPHLRSLLTTTTETELIAALDNLCSQNSSGVPVIFVSTAILKLIRTNELPMDKVVDYVLLMTDLAAENNKERTGMYSVAIELLDSKYSEEARFHALNLLITLNSYTEPIGVSELEKYSALGSRLLDVIEKSSSLDEVKHAMDAFKLRAIIVKRPVICQKICQIIDRCLDPEVDALTQVESLWVVKEFIIRLTPNNGEFLAAQGVLEKLFTIIPKLDSTRFYYVMGAIAAFADEEKTSIQIAKNDLVLASIFDHAKHLRSNSSDFKEELLIFDCVFRLYYALTCSRYVEYYFNSPYLEFVLAYLAQEEIGEDLIFDVCYVISKYVQYGIEKSQLNSIYKRIEPHLQVIIDSPNFKATIKLWQTLYCGMKLPLDMAKTLIERIIPELPLETDNDVKRSYAELLANMVEADRSPFIGIDMKLLYKYYSRELIIDDRSDESDARVNVPFAANFMAAGVSVRQFAELAIKDSTLLEKMYSLYDEEKEVNETIYLVVNFFSYVVKIPGWDNRKGLELLERWGTTMPLNAPMYYIFAMVDTSTHLLERDNPVEVLCFSTWIIARMSQRQNGRDGLKQLDPGVIEWLSSHPDPRLRKNMESYHQNIYRAEMGYIDEY